MAYNGEFHNALLVYEVLISLYSNDRCIYNMKVYLLLCIF